MKSWKHSKEGFARVSTLVAADNFGNGDAGGGAYAFISLFCDYGFYRSKGRKETFGEQISFGVRGDSEIAGLVECLEFAAKNLREYIGETP